MSNLSFISHSSFYQNAKLANRISDQIEQQYRPDGTLAETFNLFIEALRNSCWTPSSYLRQKSQEALNFYIGNAGKIRKAILQLKESNCNKAGDSTPEISTQLTDGEMFLKYDVRNDEYSDHVEQDSDILAEEIEPKVIYVRYGASGEWIKLANDFDTLLATIERDIIENPNYFGPTFAAAVQLRPALNIIDEIVKNKSISKKPGTSAEDLMPILTDLKNPDLKDFHLNILVIADLLIKTGIYDKDPLHQDIGSRTEYWLTIMTSMVCKFISDNLDCILTTEINDQNRENFLQVIKLVAVLTEDRLLPEDRDKFQLITTYLRNTDIRLRSAAFKGSILSRCVNNYRADQSPANLVMFRTALRIARINNFKIDGLTN